MSETVAKKKLSAKQQQPSAKEKILKKSAENINKAKKLQMDWQEKLYMDRQVSLEIMEQAAMYLDPDAYEGIVEERFLQSFCGYPLCPRPPRKDLGRFGISLAKDGAMDQLPSRSFCSKECFLKSKYFATQLSSDSLWVRNDFKDSNIHIIPLEESPRQALDKRQHEQTHREMTQEKRQEYVHGLLSVLPTKHHDMHIVEKYDSQASAVDAPKSKSGVHDAIEGYRYMIETSESTEDTDQVADQLVQVHIDNDQPIPARKSAAPSSDETTMMAKQKETALLTDPLERVIQVEKRPKKPKMKKDLQMTLFGKVYTMIDKMSTLATRQFLMESRHDAIPTFPVIDLELHRRQIFSEKVLAMYNVLRRQLRVNWMLETDILDLIGTLRFDDPKFVVLEPTETCAITLVFFRALIDRYPKEDDWKPGFESCCQAIEQSTDKIDWLANMLKDQ